MIDERERRLTGARVLVTGAGGFIGSHLTERLLELGCQVRAMVRYTSVGSKGYLEGESFQDRGLQLVSGDVRDPEIVEKAVEGCDYVFHLAAMIAIPYSYQAPRTYLEVNVNGTMNVLEACRRFGVKRLLQTSTSEVYGTAQYVPMDEGHPLVPQSPYAATKVAADVMATSYHRSFGLPVTVIRPFNTYGPRQSLRAVIPTIVAQALRGTQLTLGNLTAERDFTFVQDTCRGFTLGALAEGAVGRTVNLGYGACISIGQLVERVGQLLGKELTCSTGEERLRPQTSEVYRLQSNRQLAGELLGWTPQVDIDAGLQAVIEWMRPLAESLEATYAL